MSNEQKELLEFKVFCIESYRAYHKLSGKVVMILFNEYDVLDYITRFYETLRTDGRDLLIEDIDSYINTRK